MDRYAKRSAKIAERRARYFERLVSRNQQEATEAIKTALTALGLPDDPESFRKVAKEMLAELEIGNFPNALDCARRVSRRVK